MSLVLDHLEGRATTRQSLDQIRIQVTALALEFYFLGAMSRFSSGSRFVDGRDHGLGAEKGSVHGLEGDGELSGLETVKQTAQRSAQSRSASSLCSPTAMRYYVDMYIFMFVCI